MKTRTFISILILVLAVLIIAGSCATGKKAYVVQEDEELFGTWINPDYDEKMQAAKFVYKPDGKVLHYPTRSDTKERWEANFTITDKWTDPDGDIWYKWVETEGTGGGFSGSGERYFIAKISRSGKAIECSFSGYDYPPEVNPDNLRYNYRIYYRQE